MAVVKKLIRDEGILNRSETFWHFAAAEGNLEICSNEQGKERNIETPLFQH